MMVKRHTVAVMQGKFWRATIQHSVYSSQYCIVYLKFAKWVDLMFLSPKNVATIIKEAEGNFGRRRICL